LRLHSLFVVGEKDEFVSREKSEEFKALFAQGEGFYSRIILHKGGHNVPPNALKDDIRTFCAQVEAK